MCSSTFMDKRIHRLKIASTWSKGRKPEGGHPSCLLRVKGFPGHWTSGLTLGLSDDLGSWALWEWRGNKTDSMMITMAAWASSGNSLLIYLKIFKENKTRGCLLCVVGPMKSTAASVPQPLLYSGIWTFHVVGAHWPTNLAPPQKNHNPEVVSMAVRSTALGSETRFQVLASLLYVWLWNSGFLTSETQFPHEYTWNQNSSYLVGLLKGLNKETRAKCLGQCLALPYYAGVRCMLLFIFHINIPKSELF